MKLVDLFENTENFDVIVEGNWDVRVFLNAKLKAEKKSWIDVTDRNIVEVTIDINKEAKQARINHIITYRQGKGYGAEVIKWAYTELKKQGINKVEAYIEHSNTASQSMFKKLGYEIETKATHGNIWSATI